MSSPRHSFVIFESITSFIRGFWFIWNLNFRKKQKLVSVFGSARMKPSDAYYDLGKKVGAAIVGAGYSVLTGGGPGSMEAANRGAREAGGGSYGVNIQITHEQFNNAYMDAHSFMRHFFIRKYFLMHFSEAYIFLPGGYGTLDELGEVFTLMRTDKIEKRPIVLVGKSFWAGFVAWMQKEMLSHHYIDEEDFNIFTCVDTAEEVAAILQKVSNNQS